MSLVHEDLRADLARYESTAARLEAAYAELREHAQRVDRELAIRNGQLATSLAEMDRVLECLPLAVFRDGESGRVPINRRAHSLIADHGALSSFAIPDGVPARVQEVGKDGVLRHLECRQVESEDGVLIFVEDRTPQAAMEEELRRLERLGGLAELALGIAHEIRNPLNGLAGFASLVRRTPQSPRVSEWAVRIEEGARRVETTVRDLLDFARPERQSESVCLSLGTWLRVATEDLPIELDDELGSMRVCGASRALDQALANLARNSREAGATRMRARLVDSSEHRVTLRFSDDGPGVDASIVSRIFDPFVGTKDEGSGLGLAFASRAFVQMGGSLRLATDSSVDDLPGACFEIELLREPIEKLDPGSDV